ncbi:hypothetical protein D3C80_1696090 [compost metagenome]
MQGAGEERVEVLEGARVLDLRFAHVDLVALGEPADQAILEPGCAAFGRAADQARQQVVRQQVLAEDEQAIFHECSLGIRRHAGGSYFAGSAFDRGVGMVAPLAP